VIKIVGESYGVLKEIAFVLQENPDLKVKITGHADFDGYGAKNLDLSKRRDDAVKKITGQYFCQQWLKNNH
jgi:outer membrane protein OmpA-like peptidoglycan-associated protein